MIALLRRFGALCVLLTLTSAHATDAPLPAEFSQALLQAGIAPHDVGLWVGPAGGTRARLQHNASAPLNPASLMKIVSSSAALELLGPSFTWHTDALLDGPLANGVLRGNLILRGGGDPALTWDRFGALLRELRGRGLREIRGDLILDRGLFAITPVAAFDEQPERAYNAAPDALLVNFKAISLRLAASDDGVEVTSLTPLAGFSLDNRLQRSAGECGDWRSAIRAELDTSMERIRLRLSGKLAARCGERILHLAVDDGTHLAAAIFRALWGELGGRLRGTVREGATPPGAHLIVHWPSPPLSNVLRDLNKFSNNVMARQVFLSLALQDGARALDTAAATRRVQEWLASRGLLLPELVLENGSGLSRDERISAAGLAAVLQAMWTSPRAPELIASLPIAGEDGTARRRFSGDPAAGRAYLKTGSLRDVMSTAGYVMNASGQWQIVVLLIGGPNAGAGEAATRALLREIASAR